MVTISNKSMFVCYFLLIIATILAPIKKAVYSNLPKGCMYRVDLESMNFRNSIPNICCFCINEHIKGIVGVYVCHSLEFFIKNNSEYISNVFPNNDNERGLMCEYIRDTENDTKYLVMTFSKLQSIGDLSARYYEIEKCSKLIAMRYYQDVKRFIMYHIMRSHSLYFMVRNRVDFVYCIKKDEYDEIASSNNFRDDIVKHFVKNLRSIFQDAFDYETLSIKFITAQEYFHIENICIVHINQIDDNTQDDNCRRTKLISRVISNFVHS